MQWSHLIDCRRRRRLRKRRWRPSQHETPRKTTLPPQHFSAETGCLARHWWTGKAIFGSSRPSKSRWTELRSRWRCVSRKCTSSASMLPTCPLCPRSKRSTMRCIRSGFGDPSAERCKADAVHSRDTTIGATSTRRGRPRSSTCTADKFGWGFMLALGDIPYIIIGICNELVAETIRQAQRDRALVWWRAPA